jgi:hypothetical protein
MKTWIPAVVLIAIGLCAILGTSAFLGALMTVAVAAYGPTRMRSLPRNLRESAAAHLLTMGVASLFAILLSLIALIGGSAERAALASLASWLSLGLAFIVAAYHAAFLPIKSTPKKRIRVGSVTTAQRQLPWAS